MVTSASISIAAQESGEPFSYVERQCSWRWSAAPGGTVVRGAHRAAAEVRHAAAAGHRDRVLLVIVLVPGVGHEVNGSRRWLRLAGFNLQASEVARVLVLFWVAGYAVRREEELRAIFVGLCKPLLLLFGVQRAVDGGAGFRRRHGAVRHRIRPAVPRRRAPALGACDACSSRCAGFALLPVSCQLPHAAADCLSWIPGRTRSTAASS